MDLILSINYRNDRFGGSEQTFISGYESTIRGQWENGVFVYNKDEKKY